MNWQRCRSTVSIELTTDHSLTNNLHVSQLASEMKRRTTSIFCIRGLNCGTDKGEERLLSATFPTIYLL